MPRIEFSIYKHLGAATAAYGNGKAEGSVAHAQYFVAMCEWKLGRRDDAKQALARALKLDDEVTTSMADWNRRTTFQLFRHEAESLIDAGSNDAQ